MVALNTGLIVTSPVFLSHQTCSRYCSRVHNTSVGSENPNRRDCNKWFKPDSADLIALRARHADDRFTRWLADTLVHAFHRFVGGFEEC